MIISLPKQAPKSPALRPIGANDAAACSVEVRMSWYRLSEGFGSLRDLEQLELAAELVCVIAHSKHAANAAIACKLAIANNDRTGGVAVTKALQNSASKMLDEFDKQMSIRPAWIIRDGFTEAKNRIARQRYH